MAGTAKKGPTGTWFKQSDDIKGVLLDISGVLYDGGEGEGTPIEGSIDAVNRLKASGLPVRFCTNETEDTTENIVKKLCKLGFDMKPHELFAPAPAVKQILRERGLRPHLLIYPAQVSDFADVDQSDPNCVVIGSATDQFNYANLNIAFRKLLAMESPVLFAMGRGKYYKSADDLVLDVGPFMKLLEYACDVEAEVVGKPTKSFFMAAVKDMGLQPEQALMVGDDIVNDVGGAKACGLKGVQVRTGKFRAQEEPHPEVTPDGYVDNLAQAVDLLLQHRS